MLDEAFLNQDDKNYITDTVGKEAIKYLESPFGMTMSNITYRWARNGSESNDAFLCSSSESL